MCILLRITSKSTQSYLKVRLWFKMGKFWNPDQRFTVVTILFKTFYF